MVDITLIIEVRDCGFDKLSNSELNIVGSVVEDYISYHPLKVRPYSLDSVVVRAIFDIVDEHDVVFLSHVGHSLGCMEACVVPEDCKFLTLVLSLQVVKKECSIVTIIIC